MTKEQYKEKLKRMGYQIDGDTVSLETPYGLWIERIVELANGFGLETIKNPLEKEPRR